MTHKMPLCNYKNNIKKKLFLFMPVFSQMFLTLVDRHFMSFPFFPAWHIILLFKNYFTLFFTSVTNVLAGLNEGIL